ncbi:MAG: pilus assembly protein PilM [Desulfobacterales bacterium]|nr:pilus assembly protein PilM [Desulfobacterales bacterium]
MIFPGSPYPIGIDISDDDVRAVQLRPRKGGLKIRGFFQQSLTGDGDPDDLATVLKRIRKRRVFTGRRTVALLPAGRVFCLPVRFTAETKETVEAALVREAGKHLSYPAHEAIIDYPCLNPAPDGANGYEATVVGMHRPDSIPYTNALRRAGLDVAAIDFQLSSLMRLHGFLHPEAAGDNTLLCHVGRRHTMLSAIGADRILAHRRIQWGHASLIDRLQTHFDQEDNVRQAQFLLETYGLAHDRHKDRPDNDGNHGETTPLYRTVYQVLTPLVEELVFEFQRMIGYARSERSVTPFENIHLYGYGADIHGLDDYLAKRLGLPTRSVNPLHSDRIDPGEALDDLSAGAPYTLALGLALRRLPWL